MQTIPSMAPSKAGQDPPKVSSAEKLRRGEEGERVRERKRERQRERERVREKE